MIGFAPEQPLHVVALACPASGILSVIIARRSCLKLFKRQKPPQTLALV
ncbi:MAG: hypothetical protein LBJ00_10345 [Planctomycetaceae bacterium]|nr:hypothetical protein [Planctomycetaceae bacterium]